MRTMERLITELAQICREALGSWQRTGQLTTLILAIALGAITLPPGAGGAGLMRAQAASRGGILTPREVAEAAIAAIEAGRVHVAPGGGVADRARARVEGLLADIG